MNQNLCNLIGKTISSISISQCDTYVKIVYGDEYMILQGEEDCHVQTYWSFIEGKDALKDTPVLKVELTDEVQTIPESHDEGELYQAIVITTLKGRCQLEMRTENEEYYGLSYEVFVNKEPHCPWAPYTPVIMEESLPWKEWKE